MSDLDTIAINDTKHDLCDESPCWDCSSHQVIFKYRVVLFYGTQQQCDDYLIANWQKYPRTTNEDYAYRGLQIERIKH